MSRQDRIEYQNLLYSMLRIGLGLLFIYASLDKIWNPGLFAGSIANYKLLPLPLLQVSAITLPWLELLSGTALVANVHRRTANLLIGGMLIIFTLAIVSALFRGLDFNCGCFNLSSENSNIGILKVLQNLGLIGISLALEFRFRRTVVSSRA